MRIQITSQAFFDLVNQADREGTPYSFTRLAPCNSESAKYHIQLESSELGLAAHLQLGDTVSPQFFLDLP